MFILKIYLNFFFLLNLLCGFSGVFSWTAASGCDLGCDWIDCCCCWGFSALTLLTGRSPKAKSSVADEDTLLGSFGITTADFGILVDVGGGLALGNFLVTCCCCCCCFCLSASDVETDTLATGALCGCAATADTVVTGAAEAGFCSPSFGFWPIFNCE